MGDVQQPHSHHHRTASDRPTYNFHTTVLAVAVVGNQGVFSASF